MIGKKEKEREIERERETDIERERAGLVDWKENHLNTLIMHLQIQRAGCLRC